MRLSSIFAVAVSIFASTSCVNLSKPLALSTEQILENVRRAMGHDQAQHRTGALRASGTGLLLGNRVPVTLTLDGQGRFTSQFDGPIPHGSGWDGEGAWLRDICGQVLTLELGERSEQLIFGAALTGFWLNPAAPFRLSLDSARTNDKTISLAFQHTGGVEVGTIEIDPHTWLATRWSFNEGRNRRTITLDGVCESNGIRLPRRVTDETGSGSKTEFELEQVMELPTSDPRSFGMPWVSSSDVAFDAQVGAKLEVVRAPTGHLLVHPRVNDTDLGWFIFDTGAGSSAITTSAVAKLGLQPVGSVPAVGVGGVVESPLYRMISLELGPVKLDRSIMVGLDLSFLTGLLGRPIGGIIGFDLITRCVVELDVQDAGISLHDPSQFRADDAAWKKLHLVDRTPVVEAAYEDKTGLFRCNSSAVCRGLVG